MPKLLPKNSQLSASSLSQSSLEQPSLAQSSLAQPRQVVTDQENNDFSRPSSPPSVNGSPRKSKVKQSEIDGPPQLESQAAPRNDQLVDPTTFRQSEDDSSITIEENPTDTDSSTAPQASGGEAPSQNTSTGESIGTSVQPPSFVTENWPYLLTAAMFACLVIYLLITKREPSFKPQETKKQSLDSNPTPDPNVKMRGQFKKSDRFLKPKNKEETKDQIKVDAETTSDAIDNSPGSASKKRLPADPKIIEGKLTTNQQANTMQTDQPGDEEFDFDLNEEGADSDVFSFEDSAELEGSVKGKVKDSSSKRFKTEADVEAPGVKSDELEFDDEDFTFDDEDSQLSLADSDEEFGFDLDDDEESNNFLDSDNQAPEAIPEVAGDGDGDGLELADLDSNDVGLAAPTSGLKDAAQEAVEVAGDEVKSKAKAGLAGAATAAGAAAGAAAVAKKGGFFSRMFGVKDKKGASEPPTENASNADQMASIPTDVPDTVDAAATVDSSGDSFGLDEFTDPAKTPVQSLDSDDDLDFDLEDDDDAPVVQGSGEEVLEFDSESDELLLDLDDEGMELGDDVELADADMLTETADAAVEEKLETPAQTVSSDDEIVDLDSDNSGELLFDLEDSEEDDLTEADAWALTNSAATEEKEELESSDPLSSSEDDALDMDSADDSGELLSDLEDDSEAESLEEDTSISSKQTITELDEVTEDPAVASEQGDPDSFGFGVFEDAPVEPADSSIEIADDAEESNFTSSAVAGAAALGAGVAGIALTNTGSNDGSELRSAKQDNKQLQAKNSKLESQNQELSDKVASLTKQLAAAAKENSQSDSLQSELDKSQKEHKKLSESVDLLGSEKEQLTKDKAQLAEEKKQLAKAEEKLTKEKDELAEKKELLETENERLTKELADAKEQPEESEQAKADSLKQQQELEAQKEAMDTLTKAKDELAEEKELLETENKRLTKELADAKEQPEESEEAKADSLKQQKELEAQKEALDAELKSVTDEKEAIASELASLKTEIEAFGDERTAFESEIKTLQTKLSTAETAEEKPASSESGSAEDIEDLRGRFKLRLSSEHRKRKEAQRQVDEAESQRNEVAKLLRAAKAEILELKKQQDDDDFEIADLD